MSRAQHLWRDFLLSTVPFFVGALGRIDALQSTAAPAFSATDLARRANNSCPRATRVMSDFFSPLEEDDVCRTRQDEDEERLAEEALDAVGDRARVFALWNEETRNALEHGALNPSTLLVATTPWACGLVFDTVEAGTLELRPMGTITVSGVSARGVAA